jgi:hypothetical protein
MNPSDQKWLRLATAARKAEDGRDVSAPYGFATRVAALASASPQTRISLVERFSWRALVVASVLALASTLINYSSLNSASSVGEEDALDDNTVSVLLDLG